MVHYRFIPYPGVKYRDTTACLTLGCSKGCEFFLWRNITDPEWIEHPCPHCGAPLIEGYEIGGPPLDPTWGEVTIKRRK